MDCTNFTAWAYADALGVTINSETTKQAAITRVHPGGTIIPPELKSGSSPSGVRAACVFSMPSG